MHFQTCQKWTMGSQLLSTSLNFCLRLLPSTYHDHGILEGEFHFDIKNRLAPLQNGTFIRWDCCYWDKNFGRPAAVAQNWFILKTAEQTVSSNHFTYQVCTSVRKIYLMSPKARLRTGDTPTQEVKAFWMNSNKPDSASRGWAVGFFYRLMMIDHDWW